MADTTPENVFASLDGDQDGQLTVRETWIGLGVCGCNGILSEVQSELNEKGISNGVSLAQFTQLVSEFKKKTDVTAEGMADLFKVVDPKGSGKIDANTLIYLLSNFHEKLSTAESTEFVGACGLQPGASGTIADLCQQLKNVQDGKMDHL